MSENLPRDRIFHLYSKQSRVSYILSVASFKKLNRSKCVKGLDEERRSVKFHTKKTLKQVLRIYQYDSLTQVGPLCH